MNRKWIQESNKLLDREMLPELYCTTASHYLMCLEMRVIIWVALCKATDDDGNDDDDVGGAKKLSSRMAKKMLQIWSAKNVPRHEGIKNNRRLGTFLELEYLIEKVS